MREEKGIFKKIFVLLFFDILIINLAYFLALYFRFDLDFSAVPIDYVIAFRKYAVLNTFVTIIIYSLFRLYNMILQYASYNELIQITIACILSVITHIIGINLFFTRMPVSYFVFGFLIQYTATVGLRFSKKMFMQGKNHRFRKDLSYKKALIIGAGSAGQLIKRDINS